MEYRVVFANDEGKKYDKIVYPMGEFQFRMKETELEALATADKITVIAHINNGNIMELALLKDAIEHCNAGNAQHTILYLPYLPYSRADRRFTNGDCFGLRTFGRMIDNLGFDLVVTLDCHSVVAKRYISHLLNVDPKPLIENVMEHAMPKNTAIVLPDEGAKRYQLWGYPVLQCTKVRDAKTGALGSFNVPDNGNEYSHLLVVDDICDGGGTFMGLNTAFRSKGIETPMSLYTTHGIYSKGGLTKALAGYNCLFASNSIPTASNYAIVEDGVALMDKAVAQWEENV